MAIGPAAAWVLKQVDSRLQDNIPEGFEMLYDNFSLGILGWGLAVLAYNIISPILEAITNALGNGAAALVDSGLVPLADIPIEVAKVLFLNNAVNQGVLTPLGAAESAETGQSIYFSSPPPLAVVRRQRVHSSRCTRRCFSVASPSTSRTRPCRACRSCRPTRRASPPSQATSR